MKIIFVDFDETIFNGNLDASPSIECLNFLNKLKEQGHEINIYSFRTNSKEHGNWIDATNEMIEYLDRFKVPYNRVVPNKPFYDIIIDDRALGVPLKNGQVDWKALNKLIK